MPPLTAGEVVGRIKANLGTPWRDTTYRDTFKFGGPETEVKGIATTVFCTFGVVQRAAAAGLNMIIPHEDTYWNDRDDVSIVSADPLYKTKIDFMQQHGIVVFRIHDHMHAQRPDFTYVGVARALGLEAQLETAPQSHRFTVPETTLGAFAVPGGEAPRRQGASASSAIPRRRSAASRSVSGMPRRPSTAPMWTSSSAASSRKLTARSTARNTCSTRLRSEFRKAGSCWATPSRRSRGCSRWPSG